MAEGSAVNLATAYVRIVPSFQGGASAITKQLSSLNVSAAGKSAGSSYASGMAAALSSAASVVKSAATGFGSYASGIAKATTATGALKAATSPLTSAFSAAKNTITGVKSSLSMYSTAMSSAVGVSGKLSVIGTAISNGFGSAKAAVSSAASTIGSHMISMASQAASAASSIGSHFASIASVAAKGVAAGAAAATTAIAGLTTAALSSYSSYEQLTGGVETLFGESAGVVEQYAANAYSASGISANQYMEQVTGFAASLLQSLDGDTAAAAETANTAVQDMSDNANKMGTSIESIQSAYQGFAKQNYTMLDNLKLGYGGTASEMARLINDSGVLGDTMTATADNLNEIGFDTMIEAIHTVQTEMGITGTTALEAATTVEGSVNSAKAAYQNWLTGLADDNANVSELTTIMVESIATAAGNIVPRIQQILLSLSAVIQEYVPQLAAWIAEQLPTIVEQVVSLITSILTAVAEVIPSIVNTLVGGLPTLIEGVSTIILTLLDSLSAQMPTILATISAALPQIIQTITEFLTSSIPTIVDLGLQLFVALIQNLPTAISEITAALPEIISGVVDTLTSHIDEIVDAGVELLSALIDNMPAIVSAVTGALPELIESTVTALVAHIPDFIKVGVQLIGGIGQGILNAIPNLLSSAISACKGVLNGILSFFGIASPSKLMRDEVGRFIPAGIAEGIDGATGDAVDQMEQSAKEIANAATIDATVKTGIDAIGANGAQAIGGTTYVVNLDGDALNIDNRISDALQSLVDAVAQSRRNGARGAVAYA